MSSFSILARTRLALVASAVGSIALAACHDSTTSPRIATAISVVSGNNQVTTIGGAAANPLVVLVLDQSNAALSGVAVSWAINSGGGSLSSTSTTTDANGQSQITFAADSVAGTTTITATVDGLSPATFTISVAASDTTGGSGGN